jgi:hypothetical protein
VTTIRLVVLILLLWLPLSVAASDPPAAGIPAPESEEPAVAPGSPGEAGGEDPGRPQPATSAPHPAVLPAMSFVSSLAADRILPILKRNAALSGLDEELAGSPLTLLVTHTLRPTSGGQAAGFLSGVLAGSTLGLIPIVSSEMLVVRYEVMLNGKPIAGYSFERTATRAMNMWSAARDDGYEGLGKAGMEWVESTAIEAAAKLAADPAIDAVRKEIEYYFPPGS